MSDFSGLTIERPRRRPRRLRLGPGARSPGTWRPTSARARSSSSRAPSDVAATVALRRRQRPQGRRPGHRPRRRSPLGSARRDDPDQDRAHARDRDRPRRPDRSGRGRRAGRSSWPRPPRPHGLSSLPGSSPDVGVIGYTLGGGLSWLGRRYGFACNRVTRDRAGHRRRRGAHASTPTNEPDLFWALRGGGGGYAIVTALHLDLLPIADIYAGVLIFPADARRRGRPRLPRLGGERRPTRSPRSSASSGPPTSPTCRSRCATRRC